MRKKLSILFAGFIFIALSSFAMHKFYVAIYKIDYVSNKKMLQITTRIFIDDMNTALLKKYNKTTQLGEPSETSEDVEWMKKYIVEHFSIQVNGQKRPFYFHSKELENNVLICYFSIKEVTKVKNLTIYNTILTEVFPEQQNIIQTNVFGKKQSLLLSEETVSGTLKYD